MSAQTGGMSGQAHWRDGLLIALGMLALWQALHAIAGDVALSSPWATVRHLVQMMGQARFWPHLNETVTAFVCALAIAVIAGITAGIILGGHKLSGEVAEPILVALYSIPKVTLYPVILLFFGLGIQAKIAFGALHGIIPVVIFTMSAIRQVNATWLRTARAMSLTPLQTVAYVMVPATIPEIFSGLRVGLALTLLGTMIGELFASQRGLGYLLMTAIELNDVKTIMSIAVLLTIFAVVVNGIMLSVDRRLRARW